jgi:hypothetical protein
MAIRIVAGVLLIISFIMAVLYVLVLALALGIISSLGGAGMVTSMVGLCTVIFLAIAIFSFLGALCAFRGKNWWLALAGAVFAIFSFGPFFVGSICGFIALVFIAISKGEFDEQRRSMMGFKRPPRPSFYGPPPTRK